MNRWLQRETWVALLAPLRASIEESPTLQYALPVIGLVMAFYAVDALEEANSESSRYFDQLLRQEASHRSVEVQADWQALRDREGLRFAALDENIWVAESLELASADLQSALRTIARDRVVGSRIELVDPEPIASTDLWIIRASLVGRLHTDEVIAFLAVLDSQEATLVTERLNYYPNRGHSVDLQVVALFRVASDGET